MWIVDKFENLTVSDLLLQKIEKNGKGYHRKKS